MTWLHHYVLRLLLRNLLITVNCLPLNHHGLSWRHHYLSWCHLGVLIVHRLCSVVARVVVRVVVSAVVGDVVILVVALLQMVLQLSMVSVALSLDTCEDDEDEEND